MTLEPDEPSIRAFLSHLHEAAEAAFEGSSSPGLLSLVKIFPDSKPVAYRFHIGDIDSMVAAALAEARGGHNVYVEGRTVRPGLARSQRGTAADTIGVFALVIDDDSDTGKAGASLLTPSLAVESSPGNRHLWHFLDRAISHSEAAMLGSTMRASDAGGDTATGKPDQPYRVAGTPNIPGRSKRERGRTAVHPTFILEAPGTVFSAAEIAAAYARYQRHQEQPSAEAGDDGTARSIAEGLERLSPKRRADLSRAVAAGERSQHFFKVTGWLKGDGFSAAEAAALWRQFPQGAGFDKYVANRARDELNHWTADAWNRATDVPWDGFDASAINAGNASGAKASQPQTRSSDPVDLWARFDPPGLPPDLLPREIEDYAVVQGGLMGADPAGLATAALAVCAAAIPDRIKVQVKQHDPHWTEAARIWVALVGDPSTKKSPVISQAVRPLFRLDAELFRAWASARAEFDKLSKDEQRATQAPKQVRLRLEDTTIEAAQEVLRDSPDGVLCFQDELAGWFGSMDKYSGHRGAMKDRSFWLQSFNGGSYAVSRIGRGSGFIENLSVCMLGGIQPETIRKVASEAVDDGLLQRLFPVVLRPATVGRDEPAAGVVSLYGGLVEDLHRLKPPASGFGDLSPTTARALRFDPEAHEIRRDLEQRHIDLMAVETINKKLASHIGKYDGLFARLCVVFHCIETRGKGTVEPTISADVARRAATFLHRFLLPHALAFYAGVLGLSENHDALTAIGGYLLTHPELQEITFRNMDRGDRAMKSLTREEAQKQLERLEYFGWLDATPMPRNGTAPRWKVNPRIHELFAQRRDHERTRRERARTFIASLEDAAG